MLNLRNSSAETREQLGPVSRETVQENDTRARQQGSVILTESVTAANQITSAITTVLKDPSVDGAVVLQAASAFTPLKSIAKAVTDASLADKKRDRQEKRRLSPP